MGFYQYWKTIRLSYKAYQILSFLSTAYFCRMKIYEAAANAVDSGTIKTEHDLLMEEYEVVTAVIRSVIPKSDLNSEDDGVTEFSPSDDVMEFLPSSESDD